MAHDETDAIAALTGFTLDSVLTGLDLPTGPGLSNQLGISGVPSFTRDQIYNEKWEEDGAIGPGEGQDWEDEVDRELEDEGDEGAFVKMEAESPRLGKRERKKKVVRRLVERPKTVYQRFPTFERDKVLDFTELFKGYTGQKSRLSKRLIQPETYYPRRKEVPKAFLEAVVGEAERQVESKRVEQVVSSGNLEEDLRRALKARAKSDVPITLPLDDRSFDLVLLSNWEDQIFYGPPKPDKDEAQPGSAPAPKPVDESIQQYELAAPLNEALESGLWTQSIIWSPRAPFRDFTQIVEPEEEAPPEAPPSVTDGTRPRKRLRTDNIPKDRFNISNDQYYEVSKEGRHRVRQTFGQLVVEHAYPAQKLQLPFFKTRLSKQEARSFHRPALQFPSNIELRFAKVRTAKKKKDKAGRKIGKGGNVGEGLHKTNDLSLRDTSNFVVWEFSEEHPPIISNFGMGSILVNYYRKKNEKDEHVPKFDLGEPIVIEPQDESPFMKFGYVYPGQTVPAIYNNLIRAPLFRHKPYNTDFLVIKNTIKNDTKYYIREIKNLFTVGQTYPVTEVPGPHSRKITNTIKHRLQIIAYKLLSKATEERLKISRLMKYFPDQNELQMRQRLKEFMEYHRRGPHQGFWRLKPNWVVPSEAEQRKLVTPEMVVLSESMQVGQRHLQDSGYSFDREVAEDDEGNLSIEQQLAPWITTKNFLYATQAKAMLKLHGEGDPTGRGEAFSFIRVSMKDIFVKAGEDYEQKLAEAENRPKSAHRYNVAEQQQIYKSEIERIWKAQFDSLSRKDEPELSDTEEKEEKNDLVKKRRQSVVSVAMSPAAQTPGPTSPTFSRGSSLAREREGSIGPEQRNKVLRIRRRIDGEWKMEIVRDPAVINAYVKKRQIMEEENTTADALAPTGDAEKDKRAKKRLEEEIARMKKNQERRLHRKNAKIVKEGGVPMQLNRPVKPDTTRRCGHCGQMGHMKTNRKCPRWAEFNSGAPPAKGGAAGAGASSSAASASASSPPASAASPPESAFGGGFAPMGTLRAPAGGAGLLAHGPSPLAMSPPLTASAMAMAMDVDADADGEDDDEDGAGAAAPKIKLMLKKA